MLNYQKIVTYYKNRFLKSIFFFLCFITKSTIINASNNHFGHYRHHKIPLSSTFVADIETSLVPVLQGYENFNQEFYPTVTDPWNGFNDSFQSSINGNTWYRGCYDVSVLSDSVPRAIASSSAMSSAPSLAFSDITMGQGIALCPTGQEGFSDGGYIDITFPIAPVTALGGELFIGADDNFENYPKIFGATLLVEDYLIDVEIANLAGKSGINSMPETKGTYPDNSGLGYLSIKSNPPMKAIRLWFQSIDPSINSFYFGGNLKLYAETPLVYAPNTPTDQIAVVSENEAIYSGVSLLPIPQQETAVGQIIGQGHIENLFYQLTSGLMAITSATSTPTMSGEKNCFTRTNNFLWSAAPSYSGFYGHQFDLTRMNCHWEAQNQALEQETSTTSSNAVSSNSCSRTTWALPIMIRQKTKNSTSKTVGMWLGLEYRFSDYLSGSGFGGWTESTTQLLYNKMKQKAAYAGCNMTARWNKDDRGPVFTQQIFFSKNNHYNVRSVPIFQYECHQKYPGYSIFSVSQLKWIFLLPHDVKITPYGIFAYNLNRNKAFQENSFSLPSADIYQAKIAQSAALEFNPHIASAMVQESGIIFSKKANLNHHKVDFWISSALGGSFSLKQTPYRVGFINFLERFTIHPKKQSSFYWAPMIGATFNFSWGYQLSIGGRYQKTLHTVGIDPQNSWSIWCVLEKSF